MMKGVRKMKARWEQRRKGERGAERKREPHACSGGGVYFNATGSKTQPEFLKVRKTSVLMLARVILRKLI